MHPDFVISQTYPVRRERLFELWTQPELLKQWFGPAGVTVPHASMDLRPGGAFHFCMKGPDGSEIWGKWLFQEIQPPERLVWLHAFADAQGNPTRHPMSPTWPLHLLSTVTIEEKDAGQSSVTIRWAAHQANALEQATFDASHQSMQMGWTGTLLQLRAFLDRSDPSTNANF